MTMHSMQVSSLDKQSAAKRALILAVDDDDDNLVLLSYALELLDCEFVGETSGQAALSLARSRQPDLIILDVLLPDMHGVELIRQLRQEAFAHSVPIIAVTGLASPEDRAELLREGCIDYLSKPYMVDELEAMVRRYLHLPSIPVLNSALLD